MNICIVGTGYVGLVSGVCFAEIGNRVICVDVIEEKIKKLNNGIMTIYEKGLEELCNKNREAGRIEFTTNLEYGVKNSDVIFIAVGTPSRADGQADLSYVGKVAKGIGIYMNGYKVIVNKSTVPVGTQKWVNQIIIENQSKKYGFDVVSNPEFVREGNAVFDMMNPDRIVIGTDSDRATSIMKELYKPYNVPIVITNPESAEMIKYTANAFLAVKITFMNEIANVCERVGADISEVAKGIGFDARIGDKFLNAGIGYGGGCLPKDAKAIAKIGEQVGYDFKIMKSTIEANYLQKLRPIKKLKTAMPVIKGKTIGILGLAFKPNTDDVREAPSIAIISEIQKMGGKVKAYDPAAMVFAKTLMEDVVFVSNAYEATVGVDAVILVTEWKEFKELNLKKMKELMKGNIFIDGRNVFDYKTMASLGFEYYCIGCKDAAYYSNMVDEEGGTLQK